MSETYATFWEHAEELRKTLIRILLIITAATCLAFLFSDQIFKILTSPLQNIHSGNDIEILPLKRERIQNNSDKTIKYALPPKSVIVRFSPETIEYEKNVWQIAPEGFLDIDKPIQNEQLAIFSPLEGFMTSLKISVWTGILASSPLWLFLIIQFIVPGLHSHEKKLVIPFFVSSLVFLTLGLLFAFYITIPLTNQYFYTFNQEIGLNLWSLQNYLDYTVFLLLANALAFEISVIGLFLVQLDILKANTLIHYRRHVIVAAFIIGAILTPPDILSQLMLAIPLILLYEVIILFAKFKASAKIFNAKKQKNSWTD